MRCPLCDGPVVNGRCKECGMPYRNDEILYHLNESRADHYQHASDKARKIMREQQAGTRNTAKSGSRPVSRQTIQEQQREVRQKAMRKIGGAINGQSSTRKKTDNKKKKHSRAGKIWAVIILLAAVSPLIEDIGDVIEKKDNTYFSPDADTSDYFYTSEEDGTRYYSIAAGFGTAQAGVQFEPGAYAILTDSDEVTLEVKWDTDDAEEYTLRDGDDALLLTFDEGDTILVESEESDDDCIYMKEWND